MIGIVAPSSVVPQIELKLGVEQLESEGFHVKIHPSSRKKHLYFAGYDKERAQALFDFAHDQAVEVIWAARGGYGSARLLPILDELTRAHGIPSPGKLLIGYSDATALFEYVRVKWNWSVLHAPMPGLRSFMQFKKDEWKTLLDWVKGSRPERPWGKKALKYVGGSAVRASEEISGEMAGGNLIVWTSLAGGPYFSSGIGKILFFEEISEHPYRIDRLVNQLDQASGFLGVRAVVLGDFLDCVDQVSLGFDEKLKVRRPIRKKINEKKLIPGIFSEIGERRGFPVFTGLPVGHGPGHYSLPMGAKYRLTSSGRLSLESWNWLESSTKP
jgi:muramoyltetrapeptide carboxypeptidase